MKNKRIQNSFRFLISVLLFLFLFQINLKLSAQSNEECMMCHDDPELVSEADGKNRSLFVNLNKINQSPHNEVDCAFCHEDAAVEEFPHPEKLALVNCGNCHDEAMEKFHNGAHGKAYKANARYAPNCVECHGGHNILKNSNPKSRTYKMNIPILCGKCHKEGAPVARAYNISEHNILENYSQSIHGNGLYFSGLIVTATCNDCHGNHGILPHTNRKSSISVNNIASTCMKCHARIEEVHTKVIDKQLWEKKPGAIPACTDCHPPHIVNQQNIVESISDRTCLKCHENSDTHKMVDGEKVSLQVDKSDFKRNHFFC